MPKVMWLWVAIDFVVIGYIWYQVKRTDEKQDEADAQSQALILEMQRYNRIRRMPLPRTSTDEYYEAFMLDERAHPHPKDAA